MKAIATLSLATALLIGSAAYAQTQDTPNTSSQSDPGAMQANPGAMQANPPSSEGATSGSSTSTDSSSTSHSVAQACKKEATDLKLTGSDKAKYIKDCKQGKKTRTPQ